MKAIPLKANPDGGLMVCDAAEATHLKINIPGPTGGLMLPVMQSGTRKGTPNWTWNGSTDAPTLKPSVLTNGCFPPFSDQKFQCHSWITDGKAIFLADCSHELAGQTVELNEVEEDEGSSDGN